MEELLTFNYTIPGDDFTRAGEASSSVKNKLKKMGLDSNTIRKVSIAMYEGEINMVIHADGGTITVEISSEKIRMILADTGPGIADIDKAMENGYSTAPEEVRSLGFGAGMGLPNMKKYTDYMNIDSTVGVGTTVTMDVRLWQFIKGGEAWTNSSILYSSMRKPVPDVSTASNTVRRRPYAYITGKQALPRNSASTAAGA